LDLRSGKLVWNRGNPWQEGTCTVKQVATTYGSQETERLQLWQSGELFTSCLLLRPWGCKKPILITVCEMEMSNVLRGPQVARSLFKSLSQHGSWAMFKVTPKCCRHSTKHVCCTYPYDV
jgi:hypothetical protein